MSGILPAGSQVKTGFYIGVSGVPVFTQAVADNLQNTVEGCVYATGGFSAVQVAVDWHYYSGAAYVTVAVTTVDDHGAIEDVGSWIGGAIVGCVPDVEILRQDATVGQGATDSAGNPLPQGNIPPPGGPPSGHCSWETSKGIGDYLACQFGISTGSAVVIGAVLAVGVLLALRK